MMELAGPGPQRRGPGLSILRNRHRRLPFPPVQTPAPGRAGFRLVHSKGRRSRHFTSGGRCEAASSGGRLLAWGNWYWQAGHLDCHAAVDLNQVFSAISRDNLALEWHQDKRGARDEADFPGLAVGTLEGLVELRFGGGLSRPEQGGANIIDKDVDVAIARPGRSLGKIPGGRGARQCWGGT
jgi:hypothetical protein